jgi:hypothetical protein
MPTKKPWQTAHYKAVEAATKITGDTAESRLRWLVDFAREELPADLKSVGAGLIATAWPAPPLAEVPGPLSPAMIRQLHRELRDVFTDAVTRTDGGATMFPVRVPLGVKRLTVRHARVPDTTGRTGRLGVPAKWASTAGGDDVRTTILMRAHSYILSGGKNLFACPVDGRPFVSTARQEYCSVRCSQRVRNSKRGKP